MVAKREDIMRPSRRKKMKKISNKKQV